MPSPDTMVFLLLEDKVTGKLLTVAEITYLWLIPFVSFSSASFKSNKIPSYPQRKCASNVAILYGAYGISI